MEVVPPLRLRSLPPWRRAARSCATRLNTNLLPPEYTARYRQQFIDRLWMRGLGAVLMV